MLTNEQLQITEAERAALLKTREILADGSVPEAIDRHEIDKAPMGVLFDMGNSCDQYDCGTAMCIGGFIKLFMLGAKPTSKGVFNVTQSREDAIDDYVRSHSPNGLLQKENSKRPIARLFYPSQFLDWNQISPDVAVEAIDNFMTTGKPGWEKLIN